MSSLLVTKGASGASLWLLTVDAPGHAPVTRPVRFPDEHGTVVSSWRLDRYELLDELPEGAWEVSATGSDGTAWKGTTRSGSISHQRRMRFRFRDAPATAAPAADYSISTWATMPPVVTTVPDQTRPSAEATWSLHRPAGRSSTATAPPVSSQECRRSPPGSTPT